MVDRKRQSAGAVFQDLGFSPQEAAALRVRADLMIAVSEVIQRRRLTQAAAAKLMGVTQPRISDLRRGKIDRFSIDMLVRMLARAGVRVRFSIGPTGKRRSAQAA